MPPAADPSLGKAHKSPPFQEKAGTVQETTVNPPEHRPVTDMDIKKPKQVRPPSYFFFY